jgi:aspartate/methionine/tyrosine aminotransferase
MKSFFDSGVSLPIQYMVADALDEPDTLWHQNALNIYTQRRDDVIVLLQPYFPATIQKPSAALYLWIPIPA